VEESDDNIVSGPPAKNTPRWVEFYFQISVTDMHAEIVRSTANCRIC
jgi:hypothetical protein